MKNLKLPSLVTSNKYYEVTNILNYNNTFKILVTS